MAKSYVAAALLALGLGMGTPLLLIGAGGGSLLPRAGQWMVVVKSVFGVLLPDLQASVFPMEQHQADLLDLFCRHRRLGGPTRAAIHRRAACARATSTSTACPTNAPPPSAATRRAGMEGKEGCMGWGLTSISTDAKCEGRVRRCEL